MGHRDAARRWPVRRQRGSIAWERIPAWRHAGLADFQTSFADTCARSTAAAGPAGRLPGLHQLGLIPRDRKALALVANGRSNGCWTGAIAWPSPGRDHDRLGRFAEELGAQRRRGDFATWRIYLHDRATGTAERLEVMTHGGSTAFANPTATMLRDPAGRDALMVTLFLPMEGRPQARPARCSTSSPSARPARLPARARRSAHPDAVPRR